MVCLRIAYMWFYNYFTYLLTVPSVLWRCWLGGRKGIWPVKNWVVGCWRGYMSGSRGRFAYGPVMQLSITISCSSKSRLVLPFWCRLTRVVPDKIQEGRKMVVCVCVCVCGNRYLLLNATTTTISQLSGLCPGQPGWAGTRRNIHSLTPIVVINHPLSASSIFYDPWHPSCSIYVPDSRFQQSVSKFSLVYLLAWHPPLHTPYISSAVSIYFAA